MSYFELTNELLCDTILIVKKDNKNDNTKVVWVHYVVPLFNRKLGRNRTFGDLYLYWSNIPEFRFAKGYVRQESECGKFWEYKTQYFYFSKEEPPHMDTKELKVERFISK